MNIAAARHGAIAVLKNRSATRSANRAIAATAAVVAVAVVVTGNALGSLSLQEESVSLFILTDVLAAAIA